MVENEEQAMVERAMEAFWGPVTDVEFDAMLALVLLKDRVSQEIDKELDWRLDPDYEG